DPEAVRTLLLGFDSVDAAAATVSEIIASGIVPAAIEMMDAPITAAVEAFVNAGYPLDAAALLLVELDGPASGVDHDAAAVEQVAIAHGATTVAHAGDDAERGLWWKARKNAFGAVARI